MHANFADTSRRYSRKALQEPRFELTPAALLYLNVATSRARDRMILVRSVELEDLRSSDKLRRALLEHFRAPFASEGKSAVSRRERCESGFEKAFSGTRLRLQDQDYDYGGGEAGQSDHSVDPEGPRAA